MNEKLIASEIRYDIEKDVYVGFDKLKNRLEYISEKLTLSSYTDNIELTNGEIITLKENDYY